MRNFMPMLLLVIAVTMPCFAVNSDWPQWRGGPERTGAVTAPALLPCWPKDGPPLLWQAKLPTSDSPGCVTVAGKSAYVTLAHYVQGDVTKGVKNHSEASVYALDALTGAIIWQHDLGETARGWLLPGGTPAVADGRVFVIYGPNIPGAGGMFGKRTKTIKVCCLDAAKGDLLWEAEQEASTVNITMHGGPYGSPLVVDGVCLVQESGMYAYAADTGKLLWKSPLADGAHSSPAAWQSAGHTLVICTSSYAIDDACKLYPALQVVRSKVKPVTKGGVYALDIKTGEPQWSLDLPTCIWNASTPTVSGNTLLYVNYTNVIAIKLDLHTPSILWTTENGLIKAVSHYGPSVTVADGFAYIPIESSLSLLAIRLDDGTLAISQTFDNKRQIGLFVSAVVVNDQVIYCDEAPQSGVVYLLQAGKDMHLLSRFSVKGLVEDVTPTIANGLLYLRLAEGIACYDLRVPDIK